MSATTVTSSATETQISKKVQAAIAKFVSLAEAQGVYVVMTCNNDKMFVTALDNPDKMLYVVTSATKEQGIPDDATIWFPSVQKEISSGGFRIIQVDGKDKMLNARVRALLSRCRDSAFIIYSDETTTTEAKSIAVGITDSVVSVLDDDAGRKAPIGELPSLFSVVEFDEEKEAEIAATFIKDVTEHPEIFHSLEGMPMDLTVCDALNRSIVFHEVGKFTADYITSVSAHTEVIMQVISQAPDTKFDVMRLSCGLEIKCMVPDDAVRERDGSINGNEYSLYVRGYLVAEFKKTRTEGVVKEGGKTKSVVNALASLAFVVDDIEDSAGYRDAIAGYSRDAPMIASLFLGNMFIDTIENRCGGKALEVRDWGKMFNNMMKAGKHLNIDGVSPKENVWMDKTVMNNICGMQWDGISSISIAAFLLSRGKTMLEIFDHAPRKAKSLTFNAFLESKLPKGVVDAKFRPMELGKAVTAVKGKKQVEALLSAADHNSPQVTIFRSIVKCGDCMGSYATKGKFCESITAMAAPDKTHSDLKDIKFNLRNQCVQSLLNTGVRCDDRNCPMQIECTYFHCDNKRGILPPSMKVSPKITLRVLLATWGMLGDENLALMLSKGALVEGDWQPIKTFTYVDGTARKWDQFVSKAWVWDGR